jgi:hypothetical protein
MSDNKSKLNKQINVFLALRGHDHQMAAGGVFALGYLTTTKPYSLNLEMLSKAQCA